MSVVERFEASYTPEPNCGCWLWIKTILHNGYGQIMLNGRTQKAHRVSWHIHRGPIPDGMLVLHKCDNRQCVNPDHLWLGSHADNMRDMANKKRGVTARGDDHANAKLSANQVSQILASEESKTALAHKFGVSKQNISDICLGKRWGHLSRIAE